MKKHKRKLAEKPTVPPSPWDMGATGRANRMGLVEEDAPTIDPDTGERSNPNGVRRMRRVDMLEVWARKGIITTGGYNAAERLRDAFEATERGAGWPESERVASSPKPDHGVTIQIDRMSAFIAISKHVADGDRAIIGACVMDRGTPSRLRAYRGHGYQAGLAHLRDALDRMAMAMDTARK